MSNYKENYVPGDTRAVCQVCGFTFKGSELKKRYDGVLVCEKDFEMQHPLDFIKAPGPAKKPSVAISPEPTEVDVSVTYVDASTGNQDLTIPSGTFGDYS